MKPDVLKVRLRVVTPLFLGGAEPECAELRPPSIKGVLRWWYRALDGCYREREACYFGSTEEGQAPCMLRVKPIRGMWDWPARDYSDRFSIGRGTGTRNGIVYLGYSLRLGDNIRRAIPAGTDLDLEIVAGPRADEEARKAWVAAVWLLGHLGGLGSRSRRGLGTVALEKWTCDEQSEWLEIIGALRVAHGAETPKEWQKQLQCGLTKLRQWFPAVAQADHTCIRSGCKMLIARQGFDTWEKALNEAGLRMQEFRQRRDPDYQNVKAYLSGQTLAAAPARAAFGMPLTFRFQKGNSVTFRPERHDRCASRVLIRVVQIGEKFHPLFVLLAGPICPPGERIRGNRADLFEAPGDTILTEFFEEVNRYYLQHRP